MTTLIREKTGRKMALPSGPPDNSGGEGKLYLLSASNECLKIFHQPLADHDIEKLFYLSTIRHKLHPGFAWPIEPVRLENESRSCGYVMPLVKGETLEDIIDNQDVIRRKRAIDICLQIATFVDKVHKFQHASIVLGDVIKAANLMILGNDATFIDCASVSLLNLRYRAGFIGQSINRFVTPGYTAPERLANPNLARSQSEDLFALTTLFFEVLFGKPPYQPKPGPATIGFDPDDYVLKGYFFRFVQIPFIDKPTYPKIKLPHAVDTLFRAALLTDNRPSAADWVQAFTDWKNQRLIQPKANPQPSPNAQPGKLTGQPIPANQPGPPGQPIPKTQATAPVVPVQPWPTIQPQPNQQPNVPPPRFQPQPAFNQGPAQPHAAAGLPHVPIHQTKPPIRIYIPTIKIIWYLLVASFNFLDFAVRWVASIPGAIIDGVITAFEDFVAYSIKTYWRITGVFISIGIVLYISTLGYRLIAADLNILHPSAPSSSNSISHLVNSSFGEKGYIPVQKVHYPVSEVIDSWTKWFNDIFKKTQEPSGQKKPPEPKQEWGKPFDRVI